MQVSCGKCGKGATKKIEHRTFDVLVTGQQQTPDEIATATDEKETGAAERPVMTAVPRKKAYITCPARDLEIEEEFKGYCPACGFVFCAKNEDR